LTYPVVMKMVYGVQSEHTLTSTTGVHWSCNVFDPIKISRRSQVEQCKHWWNGMLEIWLDWWQQCWLRQVLVDIVCWEAGDAEGGRQRVVHLLISRLWFQSPVDASGIKAMGVGEWLGTSLGCWLGLTNIECALKYTWKGAQFLGVGDFVPGTGMRRAWIIGGMDMSLEYKRSPPQIWPAASWEAEREPLRFVWSFWMWYTPTVIRDQDFNLKLSWFQSKLGSWLLRWCHCVQLQRRTLHKIELE
jgi:hypothetical protein